MSFSDFTQYDKRTWNMHTMDYYSATHTKKEIMSVLCAFIQFPAPRALRYS